MALVQTVLLSRVSLWGARPDLMLLAVLVWAVVRGVDEGLVWAFVGGLIVDLFSGGPQGTTVLALLGVALLTGQPWGQGIGSPLVRLLLLAFLSAIVYHVVLLIILVWAGHRLDWGFALVRVAGPSALLNALLTPFVERPLAWLGRQIRQERFAP